MRSWETAAESGEDDDRSHEVTVVANGQMYGIPVHQVREVLRPGTVTRMPGAPPIVVGIVNVRGAVVTVLDLCALLQQPRAVAVGSIVLIEHRSRLIGLAVHAVRDIREVLHPGVPSPDAGTAQSHVIPLDAAALCARHLLSSEETDQ